MCGLLYWAFRQLVCYWSLLCTERTGLLLELRTISEPLIRAAVNTSCDSGAAGKGSRRVWSWRKCLKVSGSVGQFESVKVWQRHRELIVVLLRPVRLFWSCRRGEQNRRFLWWRLVHRNFTPLSCWPGVHIRPLSWRGHHLKWPRCYDAQNLGRS